MNKFKHVEGFSFAQTEDEHVWIGKIRWRRDRLPTPVFLDFPGGSAGKESAYNVGAWVQSLSWEDPLEKGKTTHSSILAWRIPWTVYSVELQSRM